MLACSGTIAIHYRIIITIRIHIVTQQSRSGADIPICIQEPSPLRVIVPALQIVQPRVRIVVVPPVPEGVQRADNLLLRRGGLGGIRIGEVAPGIVSVGAILTPVKALRLYGSIIYSDSKQTTHFRTVRIYDLALCRIYAHTPRST